MFHVQRKIVPFSVLVACNDYIWNNMDTCWWLVGVRDLYNLLFESLVLSVELWWVKSTLILNIGCCPRWPETSRNGSSSLHIYIQHTSRQLYLLVKNWETSTEWTLVQTMPAWLHYLLHYWQYDSHYTTCISTLYIIYTMIMYNILLIFIFSISNNCARASSPHEAAVCLAVPAPAGHHAVELLIVDAAVTVNVRLLSHGI